MKQLFLLLTSTVSFLAYAQVGINTETPNGATALDITATDKGFLIPRLTETQRNTHLADNDLSTVPPIGVMNPDIIPGIIIYNADHNYFEYWDGTIWRVIYSNAVPNSGNGNEGVVKINGENGDGNNKPSFNLLALGNTYGSEVEVIYNGALAYASSPTTSWPENIITPSDDHIYSDFNTNGDFRWKENPIFGQVHVWRVIAHATPGSNNAGSLLATLRNPDSGFEASSIGYLPAGSSGVGELLTFVFYTIADGASIGDGKGYKIFLQTDSDCSIIIDSVTRISNHKD